MTSRAARRAATARFSPRKSSCRSSIWSASRPHPLCSTGPSSTTSTATTLKPATPNACWSLPGRSSRRPDTCRRAARPRRSLPASLTVTRSELYGRVAVLYPNFIVYLVALAVCGSSTSIVVFILFRALMGFVGITFMICGAAVIADIIPPQRHGFAMSLMTSGPTLVSRLSARPEFTVRNLIKSNRVPR